MIPQYKIPDFVHKAESLNVKANTSSTVDEACNEVKKLIKSFEGKPQASIVIPAYNEEDSIVGTLYTLANQKTDVNYEIVVVNNNSKDKTGELAEKCGARVLFEERQGISFTRQTGLNEAKGKVMLNADGDSFYPSGWVDSLVNQLKDNTVTCVYTSYSFIPSPPHTRFQLFIHEIISRVLFYIRRRKKEFLNVMGFSFAFRRQEGIDVGGFNVTRQKWQDGWMAMLLMEKGRIKFVSNKNACVWTGDRRLHIDGGLLNAVRKRLRKEVKNIWKY